MLLLVVTRDILSTLNDLFRTNFNAKCTNGWYTLGRSFKLRVEFNATPDLTSTIRYDT